MSEKIWPDDAWNDYLYWQTQDKKTLKLDTFRLVDLALFSVDFQSKLLLDESSHTLHDSVCRLSAFDHYDEVVRIPDKIQPSCFQFLIQFVEHDVR